MSLSSRLGDQDSLAETNEPGIVEDPRIQELFSEELLALREAFEVRRCTVHCLSRACLTSLRPPQTWRPSTKVLKDTKLKLEGIRMLARPAGKL